MTNAQLYLAIGLPILAVITALVINMLTISGIREETRIALQEIRADIRSLVAKMDLLTGKVAEMDTRLAVLEERSSK